MNILHTSDWHIGRTLYGRKRYEEFEAFLAWLVEAVQRHAIDVLLAAGDIFDTSAPSNRAQELYYRFLCQTAALSCRHVVIVAGNHDSPSFLDAPKELLKTIDVHVVGTLSGNPADEVIVLRDAENAPELIVCAVPYLRDRDIRTAEAGESFEDKDRKLVDGIRSHYAAVAALAEQKRAELKADIPIVAMGHLFTAGGRTLDGDGVRELYVGSLAHVNAEIFPQLFSYIALGHLHVPQRVGSGETIRYSGSPLPMGFGEARQRKSLCLVTFDPPSGGSAAVLPAVSLIDVPTFQPLERVSGGWKQISARIGELAESARSGCWLEVIYEGEEIVGDLRERLEALVSGTGMEILRIKNTRVIERVLSRIRDEETLDDLNESDVFDRCLNAHEVPDEQRPELLRTYREALTSLDEEDRQAE